MVDKASLGPSLPAWFLYPATALLALQILYVLLRTRGAATKYLIGACWLRYAMGAFHDITFREAFGGLSWMAVASVVTIVAGLAVLDVRRFFSIAFVPVAIICVLMFVSALLNHDPGGASEPVLRFVFFVVITVAASQALETSGIKALARLCWVFLLPLTFLLASVALGVVKSGELDGSASYIGGYNHEQAFSLILATCFVLSVYAASLRPAMKFFLGVASLVGIALANYRTSILGMAPLAIASVVMAAPRAFPRNQRRLVVGVFAGVAAMAIVVAVAVAPERFADLRTLTSQGTGLIKPPQDFSTEDRHVMSSRPYIWSLYIYAYKAAKPRQHLLGLGPDSWQNVFPVYAHNTVVSFLYELGIAGVAAIFLLWGTMLWIALKAPRPQRRLLIAGHASFFMLNMATMPHWQLEGNILYAVLCGYTLYQARLAAAHARIASIMIGNASRDPVRRPQPEPA
jgi:O-antigen ligase/polysaccharide polymerase Wzy-like membrane protein